MAAGLCPLPGPFLLEHCPSFTNPAAGVLDDPPGFPYTPHGIDVQEGGKLTSNNVAGSSHDSLQSFVVASDAVSKPGIDAAGQDALHSAGVERSRFKVQGFFIRHIINYTGYNQK